MANAPGRYQCLATGYTISAAATPRPWNTRTMSISKILILLFLAAIIYNLGASLYFMMTDKGGSDRMLKALIKRVALSVLLIVLIILGILTGIIQPHGVGG